MTQSQLMILNDPQLLSEAVKRHCFRMAEGGRTPQFRHEEASFAMTCILSTIISLEVKTDIEQAVSDLVESAIIEFEAKKNAA